MPTWRRWAWPLAFLTAALLAAVYYLAPGPSVGVGDVAVVLGPGGAWLATDGAAYDDLLDAQNRRSGPLLGRLVRQGRAFREPAGSRVLVVKRSMGSAYVRVEDGGANPGSEGWVQIERLSRPR